MIETVLGNVVIDLLVDEEDLEPLCQNFIELCANGVYRGCLLYNIQPRCLAQTGDPRGDGTGGVAAEKFRSCDSKFIIWEGRRRKHNAIGLVSMVSMGKVSGGKGERRVYGSQFIFTLRGDDLEHLDQGGHCVIGEVAEGIEILEAMNTLYLDENGRPWQDVRLIATHVLFNPYKIDKEEILNTASSNIANTIISPPAEEVVSARVPHGTTPEDEFKGMDETTRARYEAEKKAKSQAQVLEMIGDLPHADVQVPKNDLFVAKLNKVTEDRDLEIIFSRFGKIKSCNIVRDWKTGDSLNFAFISFESEAACVEAYKKMNNVLVDDSRIKVDFSQSVAKLWSRYTLQYKGAAAREQRLRNTINTHQQTNRDNYGPSNSINSSLPANSRVNINSELTQQSDYSISQQHHEKQPEENVRHNHSKINNHFSSHHESRADGESRRDRQRNSFHFADDEDESEKKKTKKRRHHHHHHGRDDEFYHQGRDHRDLDTKRPRSPASYHRRHHK